MPPTRVRQRVIAVTTLMSLLLYLDRFCISQAEIYIKEDLGLLDSQVGYIFSAFFAAYALAQVGAGWIADRWGARLALTSYILAWSIFTGLHGLATGFLSLFVLRLGIGIAQAGAYPAAAGVVKTWTPFHRRGAASSIVTFGGRVGGSLALLLTGYLIIFFVPAQTPSLLETRDLLSVSRFSRDLVQAAEQPAGAGAPGVARRVLDSLSTPIRQFVEQEASSAPRPPERGPEPRAAAAASDQLVAELNALLKTRAAFREEDLRELPLEKEAVRLRREPPETLTDPQVERLNRLVLEAAFRKSVRKIYGRGWRATMAIYGLLGIGVAGLFWLVHRDRPSQHPRCNEEEAALLAAPPPKPPAAGAPPAASLLRFLLLSRSMWLNCVMQFTTNVGWVFLVTLAPRYFIEKHHVPLELRSWMVFIPPTVGWLGMLMGGWLTDRMVQVVGLRWGRSLPIATTRLVAASAYLACLFEPSPWMAVAAFSVVAFCTDLGIGSVWAFQQDVGGRRVGAVLGWGNMWGNLGAAVAPTLLLMLAGERQNWSAAFLAGAAAFLISGLAGLGIDATRPLESDR